MQRAFAFGEIGPTLYGGADQGIYQRALATCRNFFVMRHGGVANRPGTDFVAEVKNSAVPTYLLKFVFSDTDTYLIEAGNQYFRFFQVGAKVAAAPSAWSGATTYSMGDLVSSGGVNYYSIVNNNLNHAPPNASFWYAMPDAILEIPTVYLTADLPLLTGLPGNSSSGAIS